MGALWSRTAVAVFVLAVLVIVARSADGPAVPGPHVLAPATALPPATIRASDAADVRVARRRTGLRAPAEPPGP